MFGEAGFPAFHRGKKESRESHKESEREKKMERRRDRLSRMIADQGAPFCFSACRCRVLSWSVAHRTQERTASANSREPSGRHGDEINFFFVSTPPWGVVSLPAQFFRVLRCAVLHLVCHLVICLPFFPSDVSLILMSVRPSRA